MIITIVMLRDSIASTAHETLGGELVRTWKGLCDLQLYDEHELTVKSSYIIVKHRNSNCKIVINREDFSSIDIR